jgi:hypothetical protein
LKYKLVIIGLAIFLAGLASARATGRVLAEAPPAGRIVSISATSLRIVPIGPQPLAKPFTVTAVLTDAFGSPIINSTVNFLIGGSFVAQNKTNSQGQATVTIKSDLAAGSYDLRAVYLGSHQFDGSTNHTGLVILPTEYVIQTVPPLPNVQFKLGDQVFASGQDGYARVQVNRGGNYTLQVLPDTTNDPDIRVEFNRWFDEVYLPYRTVQVPQANPIQIGFQVSYKVGQTFIDLQNKPVDVSRITTITLKSSQGTTYTFSDGQQRWLPASLVTRRATGLEIVPIQYGVISVVVDGSNVVSSEQQRFYTHPGDIWPIQLLLFSARFTARDAFLGSSVGTGILLDYPDGTQQNHFKFGADHSVTINSLARGIYHVQITGVTGFSPSTPVALSQDQDMSISVLTRLDIFLGVSLGSLFALGLVVVGRTQILNMFRVRGKKLPAGTGGLHESHSAGAKTHVFPN